MIRIKGLNPVTSLFMGFIHTMAALAIFFHTTSAFVAFLALYLFSGFGISLGYHRLLTHRAFKTTPLMKNVLATAGSLAAQGGPLAWVSNHRKHHQFTDQDGDPHDSSRGFWWSHIGWVLYSKTDILLKGDPKQVPDLVADPWLRWLDLYSFRLQLTLAFLLFFLIYPISGFYSAFSLVIWAFPLRIVAVLHATWFVNSVTHLWGYRNFETSDGSVNTWWVAILSLGEGWHNNHHAFPASARIGLGRWEVDPTWWLVLLLRRFNVVWDVKTAALKGL